MPDAKARNRRGWLCLTRKPGQRVRIRCVCGATIWVRMGGLPCVGRQHWYHGQQVLFSAPTAIIEREEIITDGEEPPPGGEPHV